MRNLENFELTENEKQSLKNQERDQDELIDWFYKLQKRRENENDGFLRAHYRYLLISLATIITSKGFGSEKHLEWEKNTPEYQKMVIY
jgi:hypothetical protein